MRLMGVAPRCASVNKGLELPGNIRPIGRRNGYNNVRPGNLVHQNIHIVVLNAFCGFMTASAAPAEAEMIIIDANRFDFIPGSQLFGYTFYDFSCSTVPDRTAVDHQCSYDHPSLIL